jgi:hypothetical protein
MCHKDFSAESLGKKIADTYGPNGQCLVSVHIVEYVCTALVIEIIQRGTLRVS